jgi:hypothetical protein
LQGRHPDTVEEHKPAMDIDEFPRIPGAFAAAARTVIDAPPMRVWQTLLDPDALRAIIPGCESVEMTGPETYGPACGSASRASAAAMMWRCAC